MSANCWLASNSASRLFPSTASAVGNLQLPPPLPPDPPDPNLYPSSSHYPPLLSSPTSRLSNSISKNKVSTQSDQIEITNLVLDLPTPQSSTPVVLNSQAVEILTSQGFTIHLNPNQQISGSSPTQPGQSQPFSTQQVPPIQIQDCISIVPSQSLIHCQSVPLHPSPSSPNLNTHPLPEATHPPPNPLPTYLCHPNPCPNLTQFQLGQNKSRNLLLRNWKDLLPPPQPHRKGLE